MRFPEKHRKKLIAISILIAIYSFRFVIWQSVPASRVLLLPVMIFDPYLRFCDRDDISAKFGDDNSFGDGYEDNRWCYRAIDIRTFFVPSLVISFRGDRVSGVRYGVWD